MQEEHTMTDDNNRIIPFGKYCGQPIEILRQDADYRHWLMEQGWFRERHAQLFTLIVNNFGAPAETPEHNAMQARFLQHEIAGAVARVYINTSDVKAQMNAIAQLDTAAREAADRPGLAPTVVVIRKGRQLLIPRYPFCGGRRVHGDAGKRRCGSHGGRLSHCIIDRKLAGRPYLLFEPCTQGREFR
jgi:hypothetical protein